MMRLVSFVDIIITCLYCNFLWFSVFSYYHCSILIPLVTSVNDMKEQWTVILHLK